MENNSIFFLNRIGDDGEIVTSFLIGDEVQISKESIRITPNNPGGIDRGLEKFETIERISSVDLIEAGENIFRVGTLLNGDLAEEIRGLNERDFSYASETLDIIYKLDMAIKLLKDTRADIRKRMNYLEALEKVAKKEVQQ